MANVLGITPSWAASVASSGAGRSTGLRGGQISSHFKASVVIPHYPEKICSYYDLKSVADLGQMCREAEIEIPFQHFGILIEFDKATQLPLFDEGAVIDEGMRLLIAKFGVVIIRNAFLDSYGRDVEHRARFKHLSFHRDRDPSHPTRFSLYTRSPFCEEQREPRTSSTLFIANIVAKLQIQREQPQVRRETGVRTHYEIFEGEDVRSKVGGIIAEHAWNEPTGVGELSMLDNRTALHSSFYQNPFMRSSYRIGVRYLA